MLQIQRLCAQIVAGVLKGRTLNSGLEFTWRRNRQLSASERGAIQDICYGTVRSLGLLRAVLDELARKPISSPELRSLLLTALYQLEYSDAAPYAVVDHAVECAVEFGGEHVRAFANAILRNYQRRRDALRAHAAQTDEGRLSYQGWWIKRLRQSHGEDAERILAIGNVHPPMTLRANVRRGSAMEYLERLDRAGFDARRLYNDALILSRPVPVERLPGFTQGAVSVQDAGAQFVPSLLDLRPGMRVLDACAAPGGKAAHILECADVDLTALDVDAERLQRVQSNLARLGLHARVQSADAARLEAWWDGTPYERVLVDAPCSASGVVRRHPDVKWLRRPSDIPGFAAQQQRLLASVWNVVARGGKLLYVTCSIFSEEDHETINAFAARHHDARILGGMPGADGLLLPDNDHDGFYYALLQKV